MSVTRYIPFKDVGFVKSISELAEHASKCILTILGVDDALESEDVGILLMANTGRKGVSSNTSECLQSAVILRCAPPLGIDCM